MNVAIYGAGELGATLVQKLADRDWPGEVRLIDPGTAAPEGKALDLLQANPVLGSGTRITGGRDPAATRDADYLVIADSGEGNPGSLVEVLSALGRGARDTVVIAAVNEPEKLLSGAAERWAPRALLGTGPEALASIWRLHLGAAVECSPQDVQAAILGAPGAGPYEVFASVAGRPVEDLLPVAQWREVVRRVRERPRPGPRTLASAAVRVLQDMVSGQGAVRSCYVWSGGAYGARDLFVCAPCILGPAGVARVLEWPLEPARRVTLARALDHLAAAGR